MEKALKNKKYRFYFHYNKPESKRQGKVTWSVHYRGACHLVTNILCRAVIESKTNKRQPHAVIQGFGNVKILGSYYVGESTAVIS